MNRRSTRAMSRFSRPPLPRGIPQPLRSALMQQAAPSQRRLELRPRVSAGRRITQPPPESSRHAFPFRGRPAPPQWLSFDGGGGQFRGVLQVSKSRRTAVLTDAQELLWEVQLASNSTFSTDLTSYNVGPSFGVYFPEATRFARARVRFFDSKWSAWAVSGSPTSKASGVAGVGSPQPPPPPPGGGGSGGGSGGDNMKIAE